MLLTGLLLAGMVFVNGFTDAPNAIGTAVGARALSARSAVLLAGAANFLGVALIARTEGRVMATMQGLAAFEGDAARAALLAAMLAVVLFALGAWCFGLPTSEGHALIAGLTGAALALSGPSAIDLREWSKVLIGLGLSGGLGLFAGYLAAKAAARFSRHTRFFRGGQIAAAAAMAFLHGAQDGQKFLAVFLLTQELYSLPVAGLLPAAGLTALLMASGTCLGGGRILQTMGFSLTKLAPHQGFASDLAAGACLAAATLAGLPVSTTHTKAASIMGVGAAKSFKSVDWGIAGELLLAWGLTFPCCGAIGYLAAKLFFALL